MNNESGMSDVEDEKINFFTDLYAWKESHKLVLINIYNNEKLSKRRIIRTHNANAARGSFNYIKHRRGI